MKLEKEIELKKMEIEWERQKLTLSQPSVEAQPGTPIINPVDSALKRFPKYNKEDDVEQFLILFEWCCKDLEIAEENWMIYLRPQICGKLLEIYSEMVEEERRNYTIFKQLVQQRLQLTPEFYRTKFRTLRREKNESFLQLAAKQAQYFESWLRNSEVKDFQQLKDLIKLEQLYQQVPSDYRWLVQDRKPQTANQAAGMVDQLITLKEGFKREDGGFKERQFKQPSFSLTRAQQGRGASIENTTWRMASVMNPAKMEGNIRCFHCGKAGHYKSQCSLLKKEKPSFYVKKVPTKEATREPAKVQKDLPQENKKERQCLFVLLDQTSDEYLENINIDGNQIQGWRDTGSEVCIIRPELVPSKCQHPTYQVNLKGLGPVIPSEVVSLPVQYGKWEGVWDFAISSDIPYKCLIGNDLAREVKKLPKTLNEGKCKEEKSDKEAVCLPIQQNLEENPEASSVIADLVNKTEGEREILREQKSDDTLQLLFEQAQNTEGDLTLEKPTRFISKNGVLYREVLNQKAPEMSASYTQIVVPQKYREQLMEVAHDSPQGGHLGIRRTTQRITKNFFWPGMYQQIKRFCQSCDTCQRISSGRDKLKAPLVPMPLIGEPFSRVGIDIVGPLPKPSRRGCRYILTMIDYATRYPEAVANIETTTIANALLSIWGRTGYPKELVSDLGNQFTSRLMERLLELCGIRHLTSSAYHPHTNGLVENLNKTLVRMIKSYSQQHPHDWDIKLQQLLFAYREVPQDSTGYSPFELLYGRRVRGPLDLIREFWETSPGPEPVSVTKYIKDLQSTMEMARNTAQEHLATAQRRQKAHYDSTARCKSFEIGDEVLYLTPTKTNKLQVDWTGPWKVLRRHSGVNYSIYDEQSNVEKLVHVNMLKPYVNRSVNVCMIISGEETGTFPFWEGNRKAYRSSEQVKVDEGLSQSQQKQVRKLLNKYDHLFSDLPGRVQGIYHQIITGDTPPIASPPYRVTGKITKCIEREVKEMLDMGIVVPSSSPWASPIVLVQKPDNTIRFCVDYQLLNKVTQSDTYPMPRLDDLLERMGKANFISSLDLTKEFWQVPMAPQDQAKTAFRTHAGLYEFTVLPFGLKNSPATFQRLVDRILRGMGDFCVAYMDDIEIFSSSWEDHLKHLNQVLSRLKEAGLTIKASKCQIGNRTTKYLGHIVGCGSIGPELTKVETIHQWPIPKTKKQVRSFLGLAGYYRKFIPSFSTLAAPLTDLTRKNCPNQVIWSPECQKSMEQLNRPLHQVLF
uniref:Gypsy retrotransposon integrase-like protein 1 n=1 Tax=Anolis carolinensis TaxID=28377 RepID=A0A803SRW6_ANOCA|nr:PREDICTED: uncharacterized protein LOC100554808 [Anolis carolinensis]|eukprot:XP_008105066.1 PREDICTED: uncharacterized protein LOC100554808 [Anolis carolinensis]